VNGNTAFLRAALHLQLACSSFRDDPCEGLTPRRIAERVTFVACIRLSKIQINPRSARCRLLRALPCPSRGAPPKKAGEDARTWPDEVKARTPKPFANRVATEP
jgi:hypothetical protein